jgi:diphthamide biosynthesis methyltransferase
MSQSLHFYAEGRIITITYSRKNFRANSYPQTSLNIRVGPSSDNHIIFELDIDNDYTFTHFPSLKAFFSSLKQMQKKDQADIVRFRDQETLAFPIRGESGDIEEEELVSLNRVEEVNMRELDEVTMRVEFYNNFKNKMIHKI